MIFAIDFDGTLHRGKFPRIEFPNEVLIDKIKELKKEGHKIILYTCRNGKNLQQAVDYLQKYNIEFDAINDDVDEIIEYWKDDRSKKISADLYIDDCTITPEDFISLLSGFDDKPERKKEIKYFNEEILENECDLGNIIIENDILTCIYNNKLHKYKIIKKEAKINDLILITDENHKYYNKFFIIENINDDKLKINNEQYVVLEKINILRKE